MPGEDSFDSQETRPIPNSDIKEVITARGSTYTYLDDGRTQRYKIAARGDESKEKPPQDVLVYIPDYSTLIEKGGQEWADYLNSLGMDNPGTYQELLLEYVQSENKTIRVVSREGKQLRNNFEVADTEKNSQIYVALIDRGTQGKDDKTFAAIPVTGEPKIGFYTYDMRRYLDPKTGENLKDHHMGNQVAKIVKKAS